MYKTILVTVDGTPTDRAIIDHVKQLAKLAHGRVVLLHVADGWAARTYGGDAVIVLRGDRGGHRTTWVKQSSLGIRGVWYLR